MPVEWLQRQQGCEHMHQMYVSVLFLSRSAKMQDSDMSPSCEHLQDHCSSTMSTKQLSTVLMAHLSMVDSSMLWYTSLNSVTLHSAPFA